ncbi:MAG: hypothetical protein ABW003_12985 [Microvirga sp.]
MKLYEVRNAKGQYLGTYRAKTAALAIQRHKDEQLATAATFRKSQPAGRMNDLRATEIWPKQSYYR